MIVVPDADQQRRRFAADGEACWSAGLDVVLEKHGYLDVTVCGQDALSSPQLFATPRAVLVSALGSRAWSASAAHAAMSGPAQTFVEGPLPPQVRAVIGLTTTPAPLDRAGILEVADRSLLARAAMFGAPAGGRMGCGTSSTVDIVPQLHWSRNATIAITALQADAWRRPGWHATEIGPLPDEADVLATFAPRGDKRDRRPAIIRRGCLTAAAVGLLSFIAQAHTSEPYRAGEWRTSPPTVGLEFALLALLDDLLARAGVERVRVLPWPRYVNWALSIRHDVDRLPSSDEVDDVLRRHHDAGTRATWYWRARHLAGGGHGDPAATLRRVATTRGHEVALHTEQLWCAAACEERRRVQRALRAPLRGSCAHGESTCFRYQGAPNVLAAAHAGLSYTETLQHQHMHPHRFLALGTDGVVAPVDVVCLPHHVSFDVGTGHGEHRGDVIAGRFDAYARTGGFMQLLNHPDIHHDALFAVLAAAPGDGRIDCTAAEAVGWWRRTHLGGEFEVQSRPGAWRLRSRLGVTDVVLERRSPDGTTRRLAANLPAGTWVTI